MLNLYSSFSIGGQTSDPVGWGSQWITNHYNVQKQLSKPVILEEFGVTSSQYSTYQTWLSTVVSSGLAGDLIWYVYQPFLKRSMITSADCLSQSSGKLVQLSRVVRPLKMDMPFSPRESRRGQEVHFEKS